MKALKPEEQRLPVPAAETRRRRRALLVDVVMIVEECKHSSGAARRGIINGISGGNAHR